MKTIVIVLSALFFIAGCVAQPQCTTAAACRAQRERAAQNARAFADAFTATGQAYKEYTIRDQQIRQQQYDDSVRQQQIYQQQQQNNTYIQQGKCYEDAFAQIRCY